MKTNKTSIIIMVIFIIAVISGCASSDYGQPSPPQVANVTSAAATATSAVDKNAVNIRQFAFDPAEIKINKGESVTWTNQDSVGHDVVGSTYKSPMLQKGQSFTQAFGETGTFDYTCSVHAGMSGKVLVK